MLRFSPKVTSNIDGHWGRVLEPPRVYECHGAVTRLQCVADDGRVWPTDPAAIAALDVPPASVGKTRVDGFA